VAADSAPQAFTYAGRDLTGKLIRFNGATQRDHVDHRFLKRDGGRTEDMVRRPRRLEVDLEFTGRTCAHDYQDFEDFCDSNPTGLLVHPIAGRYQAFCEGPGYDVDFARALDEIHVRVVWVETELDASLPPAPDTPPPATAAQSATSLLAQAEQAVANAMGQIAKGQGILAQYQAQLDAVLATVSSLSSPVDAVLAVLQQTLGEASSIVGTVSLIATKMNLLSQDTSNFIDAMNDLYAGSDTAPGSALQGASLLGTVQSDADATEDALNAGAATPAGAAEAIGAVEESLAACYVLANAVQAARPPTIVHTVALLTDVVTLAQELYGQNAPQRALDIMALNHIPNPAAIPSGTRLLVPTR
jgi:prophage DNA circulation protein